MSTGTLWGFSPRVCLVQESRESNAQLHGYERTSGELQFARPGRGRGARMTVFIIEPPGADTFRDSTVEAVTYTEQYFAGQVTQQPDPESANRSRCRTLRQSDTTLG